jgi:hypothetical protein
VWFCPRALARMDQSDVAYDVHLRRVFLRTHLAESDHRDHMIKVARQLIRSDPERWTCRRGSSDLGGALQGYRSVWSVR